jgi:hypothetical protein
MKKDKLEQFIAENRDQFDIHDPDEKVWNGINARINKSRKLPSLKQVIWWAAVILITFTASFLLQEYLFRHNLVTERKDRKNQKIEIPELQEAEMYYANLVDEKILEIEPLLESQPELGNALKNDLARLDSIYTELENDLKDNIANDAVVEAMIQNYRLKLEILEDFLAHLQTNMNEEKADKNEYNL